MDDLRSVLTMSPKQMNDWREICEKFCEVFHYKLLFVNETSLGVEFSDGTFGHIYIDEVLAKLKEANNVKHGVST